MYFRVPANLANPIVMYFRVLKYTNNATRYTKVSCIVYKALVRNSRAPQRTRHLHARNPNVLYKRNTERYPNCCELTHGRR